MRPARLWWGEFAQRSRRGARVFVDDDVVLFRLRLALFSLASLEDHGLQGHAFLRKGVVGQQSFVGQETEGVLSRGRAAVRSRR